MNPVIKLSCLSLLLLLGAVAQSRAQTHGYMPDESAEHEGTWLQWPHHHTYGVHYRNDLDATWVAMTRALVGGERVHIIAYNQRERRRITRLLRNEQVPMGNIDFLIRPTDDTWVRDNGPIFAFDENQQLMTTDWGFNGWGYDAPYQRDNLIPAAVAARLGMPRINLNDVVLEGGAIEVDGNGTLMATRSSILEPDRNPDLTQGDLEQVLAQWLGVSNFIWLDGAPGGMSDITDTHIDGFARFGDPDTLVTMRRRDLRYWGLSRQDISRLANAQGIDGERYYRINLPLTRRNVTTTYGLNLGYKGSYVNYYIANDVVLVPAYQDPNDSVARRKLQRLYPNRTVVSIDVRTCIDTAAWCIASRSNNPRAELDFRIRHRLDQRLAPRFTLLLARIEPECVSLAFVFGVAWLKGQGRMSWALAVKAFWAKVMCVVMASGYALLASARTVHLDTLVTPMIESRVGPARRVAQDEMSSPFNLNGGLVLRNIRILTCFSATAWRSRPSSNHFTGSANACSYERRLMK